MSLSRDAYDAFSRVAGEIRTLALRIAEEKAAGEGRSLVSADDIREAFYQAARKTVGPRE